MEFWSNWAENIVDPAIHMGSCSSAGSSEMLITHGVGHPPLGISWSMWTLVEVFAISCWSPPAVTLLSGLGLVMDSLPRWLLWVSNASHCGPLQMYPWHGPFSSCCSFIPERLEDPWALMSGMTWSWPRVRVGHPPEPQHWWMWLRVPWLSGTPAYFPPFVEADQVALAGLFLPSTAGLWHMPSSSGAASCGNPAYQTSYWKQVGSGHNLGTEGLVVPNNCYPPLEHSYLP